VAVSPRSDGNVKFNFVQLGEKKKCSLAALKYKKEDKWANALKAVIYGFESGGFQVSGMDFTVWSDILPSAGFGITTAIKVASAWAIRKVCSLKCTDDQMLQVLERANRLFLESDNHKADSFAAIYSKKGNLVLTDYARNSFELIPFGFEDKTVLPTDEAIFEAAGDAIMEALS